MSVSQEAAFILQEDAEWSLQARLLLQVSPVINHVQTSNGTMMLVLGSVLEPEELHVTLLMNGHQLLEVKLLEATMNMSAPDAARWRDEIQPDGGLMITACTGQVT